MFCLDNTHGNHIDIIVIISVIVISQGILIANATNQTWGVDVAWGLRGSSKTLIALGRLTKWNKSLLFLACSYWLCDDSKNDLYQLKLFRLLASLQRNMTAEHRMKVQIMLSFYFRRKSNLESVFCCYFLGCYHVKWKRWHLHPVHTKS